MMIWVLIIILLVLLYGIFVEPHLIKIRIVRHKSNQGIKIVHFTDTHFSWHTGVRRFAKFVDNMKKNSPDMLLFTGDLFDKVSWAQGRDWSKLIELLSSIEAPMGKFAVLGNHDFDDENQKNFVEKILKQSGFHVLENETSLSGEISVSGIDDLREGKPDFAISPEKTPFSLLMIHEPDAILQIEKLDHFDLVVAGHSHGGQIRLGNIRLRNDGSKTFDSGLYRISKKTTLYVNSGIGLTFLPIRLGVPPEIVYYEI